MRHLNDYSGAENDDHIVRLWLNGRPASTRKVYEPVAKSFLDSLDEEGLRQAVVADAVRWVEGLKGSVATITRKINTIKSLLSFAHKTGYTTFNIGKVLRCPKVPNKLAERIVEEHVIKDVIKAAGQGRDRAILLFLYASGARNSEVCALRWADIVGRRVHIRGKGSKNRTVLLPQSVIDEMLALRPSEAKDQDHVFYSHRGNPLQPRSLRRIIARLADEADHRLWPHLLRHAHASHGLDRGAPIHLIQSGLGHANVATTSRYLHARKNEGVSDFLNF